MAIANLATNRALETVMTKAIPLAYVALSRGLLTNRANGHHRSISTVSQPRLMPNNQSPSTIKPSYSSISPTSAAFRNASRQFSTDRHLDPYERFMRRTRLNWGIQFVPQHEAYVIERFGKFDKVLEAGLHFLVPFVDSISYIHSLKEQTIEIPEQPAVTTDNVSIRVNGVLFVKVIDAEKASYGNDNVMYAVTQLAQTVMRSAIGKMPLDITFMERETLNANIVEAINDVASQWGLICARYEIRDIIPPSGIRESMVMQAEAERRKRAQIIDAEGKSKAVILTSQAAMTDSINRAKGEGEALKIMGQSIESKGGKAAAGLKVAQDYVQAFNNMAQKSTTMLLPAPVGDPSSMTATAMMLYRNVLGNGQSQNTFQPSPFQQSPALPDSATQSPLQQIPALPDSATQSPLQQTPALLDSATIDSVTQSPFQQNPALLDSATQMETEVINETQMETEVINEKPGVSLKRLKKN